MLNVTVTVEGGVVTNVDVEENGHKVDFDLTIRDYDNDDEEEEG
jgi:hypothetical protein